MDKNIWFLYVDANSGIKDKVWKLSKRLARDDVEQRFIDKYGFKPEYIELIES